MLICFFALASGWVGTDKWIPTAHNQEKSSANPVIIQQVGQQQPMPTKEWVYISVISIKLNYI